MIIESKDTFIPVSCKPGDEYPEDQEYLRDKMRSHLRDCEGRRNDWQQVVKRYIQFPDMRLTGKPADIPQIPAMLEAVATKKKIPRKDALFPGTPEYEKVKAEFNNKLREEQNE